MPALRRDHRWSVRNFRRNRGGITVVLDKGWRVGITANPAASSPEFDDSGWAIRNGQGIDGGRPR